MYIIFKSQKGGILLKEGANLETIKDVNSKLILSCLRNRSVSRAEISELTGLSRSAITTITKQLICEGQIKEIGTEAKPIGRSPVLLDIVKDYRYAMGILFHRKEIAVCIVNLKFECIETRRLPIEHFSSPEQATLWAYQGGMDILLKNHIPSEKCIGIGISSPGPLNCISGEIFTPPDFTLFHHFNPKEYLSKLCNYPVFINNAPVSMAVYEAQYNMLSPSNYLLISISRGVGAAIVQNGQIQQGHNGFSGEFGHMSIDYNGVLCSCGNRGCLERYVTKKAIMEKFHLVSYEDMIDNAYNGDFYSINIVDQIALLLASAITNVVNLLDLEAVIIAGELNYRHELLFSKIQETVNRSIIRPVTYPIKIVPAYTQNDDDISYITSLVIQHHFIP